MRYTGPKNRIARRENTDLNLKTLGSKAQANLLKKINITPGQHGAKRKRKRSEYGNQLREKQKLRYMFGLSEKQLRKYFDRAIRTQENTAHMMCKLLERRLDNVAYRLGFAPTRSAARQLVSHRHIRVNDAAIDIPSYEVHINDVIALNKAKTSKIPYVSAMLSNKDAAIPDWIEKKSAVGKIAQEPSADTIEKQINMRLVIEYYSK